MNFRDREKNHIMITLVILMGGILALTVAILLGFFGLAMISAIGILACSSSFFFLFPFLNKEDDL